MVVRLTFIKISSGQEEKVRKIFRKEIIPEVKKQKGNIDIMLLHPFKENEEHVSYTSWKTKQDADAYHSSGTYKKMVDKVKDSFAGQPVLKSYTSEEESVHA